MTPTDDISGKDSPNKAHRGWTQKQASKRFEKFRCARCGRCCIGDGYVSVDEDECDRIAEFLCLSGDEFRERYTICEEGFTRYLVDGSGDEAPCVFLEYDKDGLASCQIEPVKPDQCRAFPYKWRRPDMIRWCRALQDPD